jgi:hypothetical protein
MEAPANSTATLAEDLLGVRFRGSITVRHDGIEITSVQPKGPADEIEMKPGDVISRSMADIFTPFKNFEQTFCSTGVACGWQSDTDTAYLPPKIILFLGTKAHCRASE